MGRKYFCDYCEKSFPDNLQSRKKHDEGLNHRLRKDEHYKAFKDARSRLQEELQKTPCKQFFRGMECAFGSECRFSHLLPQDFAALEAAAAAEERNQLKLPKLVKNPKSLPNVEALLTKLEQAKRNPENQSIWTMDFSRLPALANLPHLPPSLLPPLPTDLEVGAALDWG